MIETVELKQHIEFHIQILNSVQQAVIVTDKNAKIILWNNFAEKLYGYTQNEVIGKTTIELISPVELVKESHEKVEEISSGKSLISEYLVKNKSGKTFPVSLKLSPIYNKENEVIGIVGISEDISQKKEIENRLIESEEKYRLLVENSSDVVWLVDLDMNFLYLSPSTEKLFGYTIEERKKISIEKIYNPDAIAKLKDLLLQKIKAYYSTNINEPEIIEIEGTHKNGQTIYFEIFAKLTVDKDGKITGAQGTSRNNSERKKAENELIIAKNKAEENEQIQRIQKAKIELNNERLESLLKITQFQTNSIQELLDFALDEAINLTNSKIGYIFFYDEITKQFTLDTWSKNVMKECFIEKQQTVYDLDKTGLWGEAVRQRKPIVINDFQSENLHKEGTPEGHVTLNKFLTIPVIFENKIVAVAGVANKSDDYDNSDIRQLTLLMDNVWKISERIILIDNLKTAKEKAEENEHFLKLITTQTPEIIYVFDIIQQKNIYINKNLRELLGYAEGEVSEDSSNLIELLIHPSDRKNFYYVEQIENWNNEYIHHYQYRLKASNNEWRWFSGKEREFQKKDGKIVSIVGIVTDITLQKNYEKELIEAKEKAEENEQRLFTFINSIHDVICYKDGYGKWLLANNADLELFCLQGVDYFGKTDFELSEYTDEVYKNAFINCMETDEIAWKQKTISNGIEIIPTVKGEKRIYEVSKVPIFYSNGERKGLAVIGRNISRLYETQEHLKVAKEKAEESEQRLKLATISGQLGIWDWNVKENTMIWDERMFELYGINHEKFPNNFEAWTNGLHPDDKQKAINEVNAALNGEINFNTTFRVIHLNGTILHIKADGLVIRDSDNKPLRMIGINKDITKNKIAEEELIKAKEKAEESEERFRSLIENAPDGVVINDIEGRLKYASPNSFRYFGYSEIEIIGHFGSEFTHPDDMPIVLKAFETIITNPLKKPTIAYRFRKKNGEYRWIETTFSNLLNVSSINGFVLNFSDITERKLITEALVVAKEKAEESDNLKTAFLQNMSHEIRTPMNAICGFAGQLNKPDITDEKRKKFVSIIQNSSNQLLSIVTDILTISSIETKQVKLNITKTSINNLLLDLLSIFNLQSKNQNIPIYLQKKLTDNQSQIYTDETKITQILVNLLSNAMKFTHAGFVEFGYTFVESRHALSQLELEFYVKDTGIGIKPEMHEKIFERFRQADKTIQVNYGGSGLGLSISKGFVELLGGKIWVESELEKGSTFYFTIPYNPINEIDEINSTPNLNENIKTILVAEDVEYNFLIIEEMLNDTDLKILHAQNGKDAVEICKSNPNIHLILMDIKMPIIDGHEAAICIKEFRPDLIIIAQSAYALEDEIKKYGGIFDDYITKPIKESELKQKMMKYINK